MRKKILNIGIVMMLVLSLFLFGTFIVSADGPNYMGFNPSSQDVTIGDSFYTIVWANISSEIDTCAMDTFTFQPAGIINYSHSVQGDLFGGSTMWLLPEVDGSINNASGTATTLIWTHSGKANNTNATFVNISWDAFGVGSTTITITSGGTALGGQDPGTTKGTGTVNVHPQTPTSLSASMVNSTKLSLSWSKQSGMDNTLIRYKAGSSPTSITDGTQLYNGTEESTTHSGLSEGQHVYYSAWGWNETAGFYSLTYDTYDEDTNNIPSISSESPSDDSGDVDKFHSTVSVSISDSDSDTFNWTIQGTYVTNTGANDASDGTKSANLITPLPYSTDIVWYVNVTDGFDWNNVTYNFTSRDQYSPSVPSGFAASNYSVSQINLTYTLTDDYVVIENNSSPSWSRGEGNELYNGTLDHYEHTSLDKATTYYYQAWSYNTTDEVYSSSYASASNTTLDNTQPNAPSSPTPANETEWYETRYDYYETAFTVGGQWLNVSVSDPESDTVDVSFYWSNHTLIGTDEDVASGSVATISISNLTVYTTYYWYVNVSDAEYSVQSNIYWFKMEANNWDIDRNAVINYLDASSLTSHYSDSGANGWIRDDIDDNGVVNYLDASSLTSHYGESY